jgi:hypothetical protein
MIIGNCSVHAIIIRHNTFLEIRGGGGRHISNIENVANERKSLKFHPYRSHTIYISWLRNKNKRIQRKACHESEKMYEEKKEGPGIQTFWSPEFFVFDQKDSFT